MNTIGNPDMPEKKSVYSSISTEGLLNMLQTHERAINEQQWNLGDERTQKIEEEIRLELTERKNKAKNLAQKYSELTRAIVDKTTELNYLEDKNDNNWSVWSNKAIGDIKEYLWRIEVEKSEIEEMLRKLWFWMNIEVIDSIKIVRGVRHKITQLELPL
ncbi:MAG: hypothetical protein ACD_3C00084G0005 [uncultured bacterium (gcode 4)]|uniref:Uncharacterized protein n=1 Tax=uncultured bacterium (gcode 4) TaxID=1234023 RepID=K2GDD7_9BACT|nr:MAG: hypothetical protein ACD_3C00084G0005 [uncultured bacterium (gcode 4)]